MKTHIRNIARDMLLAALFILIGPSVMSEDSKEDKVAATVNGDAVYESEISVAAGFGDAIGIVADNARQVRLERVIRGRLLRQYLRDHGVEVADSDIDDYVEQLRRNPPSAGCSCCSYKSLEEFMEANYYDMKELRSGIRNNLGIDKYLDALWEKEYSTGEKQESLICKERPRLEKEYVKVSHIFFNTFQNPEIERSPDKVRSAARSRAQAAFDRLRKGEAFGIVAKQVSEDSFSKTGGGSLGCIPFNYFGDKAAKVISNLKIWEYSEPVESTLGFHIFLREPITRNNILALIKESFTSKKREDIETSMTKEAKVERATSR